MSWQAYVDTNLVGSGKVSKAAIIGLQGGVWASSAGYDIPADEQKAIVNMFKDPSSAAATGVKILGNKFFVINSNERSIYGKKQADGVILVKTTQAILVTEYQAPIQAGESVPTVEGLADYLIGVGY
ncbi:profilin [Pterulicium gracile]|uniref:Profilin n=1 Tax=Pterulicium gracile TaxID=1884261 RepID=A0A5C3Q3Q6_9AGAR|nr:profilin [Pterula gracilis]